MCVISNSLPKSSTVENRGKKEKFTEKTKRRIVRHFTADQTMTFNRAVTELDLPITVEEVLAISWVKLH